MVYTYVYMDIDYLSSKFCMYHLDTFEIEMELQRKQNGKNKMEGNCRHTP